MVDIAVAFCDEAIETHRAAGCAKLEAGIRVIGNEPRNDKYFRQHQA